MIEGICICTVSEFFLISRTWPVTNASKSSKATTEWKFPTSIPCPGCKEGYRTKAPNLNAPARQLHGREISKSKTNKSATSYKLSCTVKFRQLPKDAGNQIPTSTKQRRWCCSHNPGHSSTLSPLPVPDIKVAKLKKLNEDSGVHSRGKNPHGGVSSQGKKINSNIFVSSFHHSRSVQLYFKNTPKSWLLHSWRWHTRILTACEL